MSKTLNRTDNRHAVLRYIADNPGQIRRSSGILLSLKEDFYGGVALETVHGIRLWKRACADMLIDANMPLDRCTVPTLDANDRYTRCAEPPVAVLNVRTDGVTIQEPRCIGHLNHNEVAAVPFSTI